MNKIILFIEKYTVKFFLTLLGKALRIVELTPPPNYRCIYILWHRNLLPLMHLYRFKDIVILISPSQDGELIAGPATLLGYKPVRGSSTRNSIPALRELLKYAQEYSIAITPDGPIGPREVVKESGLYLAYKTGLPLVAIAVDIDKEWVFRTWDLFRVPKPFSTVKVSYGEPVFVKTKEDIDNKRLTIQRLMDRLTSDNREAVVAPELIKK